MKKWLGLVLSLTIMASFLVGCGVPREDYDKVSGDLAAAQTQIQSLQSDLASKNAEIAAKDNELSAKETELTTLQNNLSAKETELLAAQNALEEKEDEITAMQNDLEYKDNLLILTRAKITQALTRIDLVNGIFVPSLRGELNDLTDTQGVDFFLSWLNDINAIDDPEMTTKFMAMIDSGIAEAATVAFLTYLLESVPATLD